MIDAAANRVRRAAGTAGCDRAIFGVYDAPMIRLAREDDLAVVCRTAMRAFTDDPVMRWLIPDDDDYETVYPALFAGMFRRWTKDGTLWVTDEVVAFGGWERPGRPEVEVGEDLDYLPGEKVEHPEDRFERFVAIRGILAEMAPTEEHWYLNLLGTHPDWQRQGLGRTLMAEGFALADEAGVPCYLETETLENVAYYRHHGFEVSREWDVPLDGPHMWGMLRPAQ